MADRREVAAEWIYRQRRRASHNADIWHLRFHRGMYPERIWQQVDNGEYRLLPPQLIRTGKQDDIVLWSAADAMVMKWVAMEIQDLLPLQSRCVHTAGHRGGRGSLAEITQTLAQGARFVWRTDIRGYYRHIRKEQLWHHVCRFVRSPVLQNIIKQYIWYTVEHGGEFFTPQGGICRGSALSPLLGASFLWYVDSAFSRQEDIYYVRYMDDFLFLSTRRWPLRRAVRRLHDYFEDTGFECHPDKTQVGRTERGFDWLGVWFNATGPAGIAPRAKENHRARRLRLEEQARRRGLSEEAARLRVQQYEARWTLWAERQMKVALHLLCMYRFIK
ncbi:reverse transcriptase domain-containing protein [Escherichia marmotae]|nr:reverse transcriptase domain-containing protein [Escherichia marmotae]